MARQKSARQISAQTTRIIDRAFDGDNNDVARSTKALAIQRRYLQNMNKENKRRNQRPVYDKKFSRSVYMGLANG